ncbi:PQQ-binding-like beta-propeller repeat protein [Streptomyces sp. NPDC057249]|uniref:outer membrane protein assembly factor BamB family protein n=1 Tax=Streptomyces sp. NPDC057249 TaxID=3346067 RepID=UPI0036267B62
MSGRGTATARRWGAAAAGAVLAAVSLTGCGSGGGEDAPGAKATEGAKGGGDAKKSARRAYDPPLRFEGKAVVLSGSGQPSTSSGEALRPAVTLVDGVAYVDNEGGIVAIDTRTGDSRWYAETKYEPDMGGFGTKRVAPLVSDDGRTVYAAWWRQVPGEGTMPDRSVIEVLAVDTGTGRKTWSAEIPPDPSSTGLAATAIGADGNLAPQVVGVDAGTAIVTSADTTYALDPATGAVRWKKGDYRALNLAEGVVAGGEETGYGKGRLLGVDAETGKQRWTVADARQPAHAAPALLSANLDDRTVVVDAVSGETRVSFDSRDWRCLDDARTLVACSKDGYRAADRGIVVFDATTFRHTWVLPDHSGRSVPKVTGFWHGALYGKVGGRPVVLDGTTGKDRETEPNAAPIEIDRYGGVEGTRFIPAVG